MIEVKAFQACSGDCIWLRFGKDIKTNIVIDVGMLACYKTSLRSIFEECIKNKEVIDTLIITHTDSDHISGLKGLYNNTHYTSLIKEVWINTPDSLPQLNQTDSISFKEGNTAQNFFKKHNIKIIPKLHNEVEPLLLNGSKITVLSPSIQALESCNRKWKDYNSDLISGKAKDWHLSLEELSSNPDIEDTSVTNSASIAFLFDYENRSLLFLGDSVSSVIVQKLTKMGYTENNPLQIDLVKLAHHGSRYNISKAFRNLISCGNYLISSNGNNLSKESLAKIVYNNVGKSNLSTNFYFNFDKDYYKDLFSIEEEQCGSFKTFFADKTAHYNSIVL